MEESKRHQSFKIQDYKAVEVCRWGVAALWLTHTHTHTLDSLFIIFYNVSLSGRFLFCFLCGIIKLWMQIFSVGKSAADRVDYSTSYKRQKISHSLWEWGAAGTANAMTTFKPHRWHPCGMLMGSRATQVVYKQPGSMNPQEESGIEEEKLKHLLSLILILFHKL